MVRIKRKLPILILLFLLLFSLRVGAAEQIRIEQVQTNLPEVVAYFYIAEETADQVLVKATLGYRELTTEEVRRINKNQDATHYYFLVDCSTSTRKEQLAAVKQAVTEAAAKIGPNDKVTLVSFGLSTEVLLHGETDVEVITSAVEGLAADQKGTVFFDALAETIALANKEEDPTVRKLAFIFSDSVDVNTGGYTKEEISTMLETMSLPFYAFGFDTGSKEGLDQFGAVARQSGGTIQIVSHGTLPETFQQVWEETETAFVAVLKAENNVITESNQEFTLEVTGTGEKAQLRLPLRLWIPDAVKPQIISVEQQGEQSIRVVFSEGVKNADMVQNYRITDESGNAFAIYSVAYEADDFTADLLLGEVFYSGQATLTCTGITDISMEENGVEGEKSFSFAGLEKVSETEIIKETQIIEGDGMGAAWFVLTIIVVAIIAGIVIARIRKNGGLVVRDGKVHFKDAVVLEEQVVGGEEVQVHFVAVDLPKIRLDVIMGNGESRTISIPINKSLFVGRSEICEVRFDDRDMSRQHFVIEENDGNYFISNLSETNGTRLNGVALSNQRPLYDGDRIEAGNEIIVFYRNTI